MNTIVALHGYLGQPHDWEQVFGPQGPNRVYPNLFEDYPIDSYNTWARHFNTLMAKRLPKDPPKVIVGYSMGGRLALHVLKDAPDQWDLAVIISTNPGLHSESDKWLRLQFDTFWAEKVRSLPWDALMKEWYALDIFAGDIILSERKEQDFKREHLAKALTTWSAGVQEDLRPAIAQMKMPILWIVGERDKKYSKEAVGLQFSHPLSRVLTIKEAGHRVLWYHPKELLQTIDEFITRGINDDGR